MWPEPPVTLRSPSVPLISKKRPSPSRAMPPRKWMERGAPLARTPLTNTCSGVPSKASRLTALVIESLETSKRAPFVLVDEGQRREVARDDRSLEGKIGSVGLGLSDAGSPGGVRRA